MLKSHTEELLQVYQCLFEDIGNAYPALRGELSKDYLTLVRLADERGVSLFCVDLPNVGKHLDRCVSEGKFSVCALPLTKRCPRCIMYPQFLKELWALTFHESGCLKEDCDVEALLFLRQVYYMAKKVNLNCPTENVLDEVRDFFQIDALLPEPERSWTESEAHITEEAFQGFSRSPIYSARASASPDSARLKALLINLDVISGMISSSLGPYDPKDWSFRHGPGVVSERKGPVNKYQFVNWSDRLESVYPIADFGYYNYSSWGSHAESSEVGSQEPSSRMISVPKTLLKPRLIAAEPTEHMWCQQNIWHYMRQRVSKSWLGDFVRFNDQSLNQDLCKRASIDGSLTTIDLSNASDRVTCHFVGQLFSSNLGLLAALRSTRTHQIQQDYINDVAPVMSLKKFSTMGNACTFPVETLGFLAVSLAAIVTQRSQKISKKVLKGLIGQVAVFGDDIIVPTDCRELVCNALEILHFKVNLSKSYWSGNFRESCGVDAFRGVNLTPVYWRSITTGDPESIVSAIQVRNSFYKRGYWNVARHIASTVRRGGIPTVSIDSGVFGYTSFCGPNISGFCRRMHKGLQRDEVRVLKLSSRRGLVEIKDDSVLLQFFTENPEPHQPWVGGVGLRPKLRLAMAWEETNSVVSK